MFTGIIEEKGIVKRIERQKNLVVISILAKKIFKGLKKGDSVCVNGVCLTATSLKGKSIAFDVVKETLLKTTIGHLKEGSFVNLEAAVTLNTRMGGHCVSGHIDTISKIIKIVQKKNYSEVFLSSNSLIAPYIIKKGSICLDGVSLTVGHVDSKQFSVHLIPYTKEVTTLGNKRVGDLINIETDILAKYIINFASLKNMNKRVRAIKNQPLKDFVRKIGG